MKDQRTIIFKDGNEISEVKHEEGKSSYFFKIIGVTPCVLESLQNIVKNAGVRVTFDLDGNPIAIHDSEGNPITFKYESNKTTKKKYM